MASISPRASNSSRPSPEDDTSTFRPLRTWSRKGTSTVTTQVTSFKSTP